MFDWYLDLCRTAMIVLGGTISIIVLGGLLVIACVELYDAVVERINKNENNDTQGEDQ